MAITYIRKEFWIVSNNQPPPPPGEQPTPAQDQQGAFGPPPAVPAAAPAPAPGGAPVPGQAPAGTGLAMKRRNPAAVWIGLPLITFGIYGIVWYYKIQKEMKEFDPRIEVSPGMCVVTMLFGWILLFIPPYVSFYKTGKRIAQAQHAAGLPQSCSALTGLLLCFVFGLGTLYYQAELNKVTDRYPGAQPGVQVPLTA